MMLGRRRTKALEKADARSVRGENVAFVNAQLATEISQRNARKDAQENTARGLIATAGVLLTLLIGLANDAGVFRHGTSVIAKGSMIATVVLGALAAGCAMYAIWPRQYDRLGQEALAKFNQAEFLDQAPDRVAGTVVASQISIATTMDRRHGEKGRWVKLSLGLLGAAFVTLVLLAVVLVVDPPPPAPAAPVSILLHR